MSAQDFCTVLYELVFCNRRIVKIVVQTVDRASFVAVLPTTPIDNSVFLR